MGEIIDKPHIIALHGAADLYGSSKILLYSVEALSERFQVTVILPGDGPLVAELNMRGTEVLIMPLGILRRKYFNLKGAISRALIWIKSLKHLRQVAQDKNTKAIYSNTTAVLIGAFLAKRTGIRHVWHIHEIIDKPRLLIRVIAFLVNKYSDKVIVVSDSVYHHWCPYISKAKIERIYNGISQPKPIVKASLKKDLKVPPDDLLLGTIGRIHPVKGIDYFIDIAYNLTQDFHRLQFIIVGDAFSGYEYLYDEMFTQIKEKELEGRVHYLGYRTDIPGILEEMDIFILPSTGYDSFPTVILEAMSSGVPVVATNRGGAPEMIVEGVTGVLIEADNARKAANRISPLIEDSELRRKMGASGKIRQEMYFSKKSFDKNIKNLFEKVIEL